MDTHFDLIASNINFHIAMRVIIAIALGAIIGIERELTSKWAGLRTHMLVCVGAAVFTILSIYGFPKVSTGVGPLAWGDPARVAAQIVTGIGFIGAGTVLRHGPSVMGLTTAATLWVSASIGMAVGAGSYFLAILTSILTVIVLIGIRKLEYSILKKYSRKHAYIKIEISCQKENLEEVMDTFYKEFADILKVQKTSTDCKECSVRFISTIEIYSQQPLKTVQQLINKMNNIESFSIQQISED